MKYLQSDNSKNTYGLYRDEIGPGHLVAIIEFETVADGDKLIRPIASAPALLAVLTEPINNHRPDFASDIEEIARYLSDESGTLAADLRAKAQAIRAAVAEARGEAKP